MNMCLRPCQEVVSVEEYASEAARVAEGTILVPADDAGMLGVIHDRSLAGRAPGASREVRSRTSESSRPSRQGLAC